MTGCGLLVSVRDVDEADAAVRGGAAIIDVKEPLHGALGCAEPAVAAAIARAVGGVAPWTAALGELADGLPTVRRRLATLLGALDSAVARPGAVKVGLAGMVDRPWQSELAAVFAGLDPAIDRVAVGYADWQEARAPDPHVVIAAAARLGCRWVLFDTAVKNGAGLLGSLPEGEPAPSLDAWIQSARRHGLAVAVAGSLTLEQLPEVAGRGADVVGLRTAVCSGGRFGCVAEDRVRHAVRALERAGLSGPPVRMGHGVRSMT